MTLEVKHGELFTVLSREDMGTLAQLQSTIEGLYARIQDLKPWMEGFKIESENESEIEWNSKFGFGVNMPYLIVDAVRFAARKLGKSELAENQASFRELSRFARSLDNEQLTQSGIPLRYKKILNEMSTFAKAHHIGEGDESDRIASLLVHTSTLDTYLRWKDIFPILYGETIEKKSAQYLRGFHG